MKLKNKKTGEIRVLPDGFFCGDNLKKICEDWEDYEEPKGIQCIYYVNHFDATKIDGVIVGFGTKEEAEKAVEKLKAWKRLKDNSWKPVLYNIATREASVIFSTGYTITEQDRKDLDLLFGGEE